MDVLFDFSLNTQQQQDNNTQTTIFPSVMNKEEQVLFCFDDVYPVCISEDDSTTDIEPQGYVESLEARVAKALQASKGFTDLVELAEAYESDGKNQHQTEHNTR